MRFFFSLVDFAPYVVSGLIFASALITTAHVVLYKRDARAAFAWVGVIWLVPVVGVVLYGLFGINRIRRRAQGIRQPTHAPLERIESFARTPADVPEGLRRLAALGDRVAQYPLAAGNRVGLLVNGDQAFPAMLEAIDSAQKSVALQTYIFDNDRAGRAFTDALVAAVRRGVEVRVLIDDVGTKYSWPPAHRGLARQGVPVATFLPTLVPWRLPYVNLRNHRKILVVDGSLGFTGGINIREGNLIANRPRHPIRDLHARIEGPVVAHLQRAFVEDWQFASGETLEGETWFPRLTAAGEVTARGILDGPDENFEALRLILLGALATASERVSILTPYFVPDAALLMALGVSALRGVEVDIVLPEQNNLALVQWASMATVWQVIERGCRVWLAPGPFDHSKLMVVDDGWTLVGSANWDARTLRLNFEFNVECYDTVLARQARRLVEERIEGATPVTLEGLESRPLLVKLRDGTARLLSPYL